MEDRLFSVNRAADVLGRDRQTLVRALRTVPPDGHEHGQPRWKMPTIAAALAVKPHARRETGRFRDRYSIRGSKALDGLLVIYEKRLVAISSETSPDRRREMALALAPLLGEFQTKYLGLGRELHIADDDTLGCRADLIWSEMLDEISAAAEWPRHSGDFAVKMIVAMDAAP